MSLESTLLAGQAAWLDIATDTCRITKPGVGAKTFDEGNGQNTYPARVVVYEGPCRVQVKVDINSNVVETTAGDREATYLVSQLQLPVLTPAGATGDVADVDVDHVCEILTSPNDPTPVGVLYNLQGIYHKSHAVYRRFRAREVIA